MQKNRKLIKTLSKYITLITFIASFSIGGASLIYQYQNYSDEVLILKKNSINQKKSFLKDDVSQKAISIEEKIEQVINTKYSELRGELSQLNLLLSNIYQHDIKTSATNEHIKEHLTDFFGNNSFWKSYFFYYIFDYSNNDNGFIYTKNCLSTICDHKDPFKSIKYILKDLIIKNNEPIVIKIYSKDNKKNFPNENSLNTLNKTDIEDNILNNQKDNLKTKSQNFITIYSDGIDFDMVISVIHFSIFNWVLVTGYYLDELDKDITEKVVNIINKTPFFNDDYFYLIKTDGTILTNAGDPSTIGKNLNEYSNSNKIHIFKETLKAIKNENGGFIEYLWKKPNKKKEYPKITFVRKIKNRDLIIGKGVYIDDLYNIIEKKKDNLKGNITKFIVILTIISLFISVIALLIIQALSKKFIKNLDAFIDFFEKSSLKSREINPNELYFDEFKILANAANFMIKQQKENEMIFKLFVEQSKDGVMIIDDKGFVIECNQVVLNIMDFTREEILFREIWEIQSERMPLTQKTAHLITQMKIVLEDFFKNIQENITEHPIEQRLQQKNGDIKIVQSVVFPIKTSNKIIFGSIIRDITEQKQIEKDLIAEKERLAVTLRSIKDGVIVTNNDYLIVSMNPSAERLTGWKQIEAVGKNLNQIFRIFFQESDNQISETILLDKNGGRKIITDSFAPIYDNRGKILGTILVFQDVTERHKINFERQKMQKLESIGILAGKIAHDFNNLLTGILGYINLAKVSEKAEDINQNLQKAEETTISAQKISNQFITFSRGGEPVKKGCNLFSIVTDVLNSINFDKIELFFISNVKEIPIFADEHQLYQMIKELLYNAKESIIEAGKITLSVDRVVAPIGISGDDNSDNYALLSIKDNGIGMSDSIKKRVFEPYFTTKDKKNGLGLTIVESILIQHNGKIEIHSKENEGTLIQLFIPLNKNLQKNSEKNNNNQNIDEFGKSNQTNRILIMDDEDMILKLSSKMLKHLGYDTDTAKNGEDTIKLYKESLEKKQPYLGVILDLTILDGMGGVKTLEELLLLDPNVKAIVSSGYSDDSSNAHYKEIGFAGYLPKPYKINQLLEAIESVFKI
ncbi:cache domain-containing protein [bacterium]|nr:cache domain-containing protein [bacterium]